MSIMKCGHPSNWVIRVKSNGRVYTYCIGCMIERLGLDNTEVYPNPYIKIEKVADRTPKEVKKGQKEATKIMKKIKE